MLQFVPLGGAMWGAGLVIGLWFRDAAVVGAWLTGIGLIGFGATARRLHRLEG